jgi:hypothetical protein
VGPASGGAHRRRRSGTEALGGAWPCIACSGGTAARGRAGLVFVAAKGGPGAKGRLGRRKRDSLLCAARSGPAVSDRTGFPSSLLGFAQNQMF